MSHDDNQRIDNDKNKKKKTWKIDLNLRSTQYKLTICLTINYLIIQE